MHLRKSKKTVVAARVSKGKNGSREDREVMGSQTADFTGHCEEFGFYSKGNQELQSMFLGRNLYFTIWVLCWKKTKWSESRETNEKAISVLEWWANGHLDHDGCNEGGEKWLDSLYTWQLTVYHQNRRGFLQL